MITIKNADLLNFTEQYAAHQCNCVSTDAKGIARYIFQKFPNADTYKNRPTPSIPGNIDICGNIINMYAQYYPTVAKYTNDSNDKRIIWFKQCLVKISQINNIHSIAIPYNIGCGLAGGNWNIYYSMIEEFAVNTKINVTLYKL